jgi:Flp pilus assembly protein TadG
MQRLRTFSKGQFMILYGLAAVGLLGALALTTDVSIMYLNSFQLQKGADAAAIAGANFLTGIAFTGVPSECSTQPDDAKKAACTYALSNGLAVDANSLTLTEPTSSTIHVAAKRTSLPYYFGRAVGLNTYDIAVGSTGQASQAVGTVKSGLLPLGLQCTAPCTLTSMDPGQSVAFGQKFVGGLAPGNWQWLALGGTGNNVLGTGIQSGATGSYSLGNPVSSEPGNSGSSSNVVTGLAARLVACATISDPCTASGGNPNTIPYGDPCLVIVPAVDYHGCNGSCDVTVEGFAQIYLEQSSTGREIDGCFVKAVAANTVTSSNAPQLGAEMPPILIQ